MQEKKLATLSKVVQGDKNSVSSSFCFAPGIVVYLTTVLLPPDAGKTTSEDTPWPLANLP